MFFLQCEMQNLQTTVVRETISAATANPKYFEGFVKWDRGSKAKLITKFSLFYHTVIWFLILQQDFPVGQAVMNFSKDK